MGDARICGGGWLVHGPASGCDFRQLRLQRSLAVPAVCAAGFGWIGARKHRSLRHWVCGWRGAVAQAAFARAVREDSRVLRTSLILCADVSRDVAAADTFQACG